MYLVNYMTKTGSSIEILEDEPASVSIRRVLNGNTDTYNRAGVAQIRDLTDGYTVKTVILMNNNDQIFFSQGVTPHPEFTYVRLQLNRRFVPIKDQICTEVKLVLYNSSQQWLDTLRIGVVGCSIDDFDQAGADGEPTSHNYTHMLHRETIMDYEGLKLVHIQDTSILRSNSGREHYFKLNFNAAENVLSVTLSENPTDEWVRLYYTEGIIPVRSISNTSLDPTVMATINTLQNSHSSLLSRVDGIEADLNDQIESLEDQVDEIHHKMSREYIKR